MARNVGPTFIYDNTDGDGTFVEHEIVSDFRGHTPRVGDKDRKPYELGWREKPHCR